MGYVEDLRALVGQRPLLFVGSLCIITNEKGEILLQQRKHPYKKWGLPGGLMELGESTEEAVRREVLEETGLTLGDVSLLDVYSGADYYAIAANGDEFYTVTTLYHANETFGDVVMDESESLDLTYIDPNHLPEKMVGSHLKMIREFLSK